MSVVDDHIRRLQFDQGEERGEAGVVSATQQLRIEELILAVHEEKNQRCKLARQRCFELRRLDSNASKPASIVEVATHESTINVATQTEEWRRATIRGCAVKSVTIILAILTISCILNHSH